jgi:Ca-activated chloride channel family protein
MAVGWKLMNTIYANVGDGTRHDISVELISHRELECGEGRVTELVVSDQAGEEFTVLVAPDANGLGDLATEATYRLSGMLGAIPVYDSEAHEAECPACTGDLRPGQVIDATGRTMLQAAAQLELDETFGIIDRRTTVHRVRERGALVDDWDSMKADRPVESPDYVCVSCGSHVNAYELHDGRARTETGENQTVDSAPAPMNDSMASPETVGLATGGAKDATNFRDNVENGYTPQPEAISDEGLFYDYYFETGNGAESDALFAPRYAAAVSDHPLTGDTEQYLSVGLDSTLSVADFERPRLELVAVLDVSGSMSSPFDAYYYDEQGRKQEAVTDASTKMEAAAQSLCALTEQLDGDDRLGVVLYNSRAHIAKPIRDVETTDMPAIRSHIRDVSAGGGTNLADGFEAAVDMLGDGSLDSDVERRVVFMTDMMPNVGTTGNQELTGLFADAAADGIHTTFIGMGLDANAELVDTLSGIRGANHYFVHSATEFERRLGDEFDYMVTPLVYDLSLELEAAGYEIDAVHGSPSADEATDQLMHVETLFPSAKQDGEARGGVVLVRLAQTSPEAELELAASWTERDGSEHTQRVSIDVPEEAEGFAHDGVRKAVVLARYVRELREWARAVHERGGAAGVDDWALSDGRGQHERQSVPLAVPQKYGTRFERLREYVESEASVLEDETLQQEVGLLTTLCESPSRPKHEEVDS